MGPGAGALSLGADLGSKTGSANGATHVALNVADSKSETVHGLRSNDKQAIQNGQKIAFVLWTTLSMGVIVGVVFWPYVSTVVRSLRKASKRSLYGYLRLLSAHPFSARAISAGIIFFTADVVAQKLYSRTFSYSRLWRYSMYGLAVMGPFLYLWYFLMHVYGPSDSLVGSIQKALFEQITLEPACIFMYILFDGVVRRRGVAYIRSKLLSDFVSLWTKNAVFWIPSNFANYYLGTQDLRVVFANICSFFWNVYFSSRVNGVPSFKPKDEQ
mmetsp:Transcript_31886/g.78029  ORF Transcript_31886/g.78029 Transcript_31886/m.78029 type:complete len:271 (-) Transcript_31886:105-917(-)